MSSAIAVRPEWRLEWNDASWIKVALVAVAFAAVFYNVLLELGYAWYHYADWSHGWIVPLFSAYLVYNRWSDLARCTVRHAWVGLLVMLAGLALYQYSLWGLLIGYLRPFSMLICLLGVILFLCGLPAMRYLWVPWLYLFFAIPLPKGVYFALTDPLRRIAATASVVFLSFMPNLEINRVGSTLEYTYGATSGRLDVADACSGMRSTITLCALGTAVAFLADRPAWQRLVLLASCIPIAIFSNLIRVIVTSLLHIYVDPSLAEGTPHMVLGLVTMGIALLLFLGLGWLLSNLVTETTDDEAAAKVES
jgi:exosortase